MERLGESGGAEEHNSLLFFTLFFTLAAAHLSVGWLLDLPYGGRYPFSCVAGTLAIEVW